jgi:hypothetical protein
LSIFIIFDAVAIDDVVDKVGNVRGIHVPADGGDVVVAAWLNPSALYS